ncbi:MAG: threonine--tRNA ligase [Solirubrobacterales bacterium]|nr:threonine--tRNA ligase [Solirubrobacterales bacterium]
MKVILPDGNELALADGATGAEAAAAIGPGLAKAALAVTLDGQIQDLAAPLRDGAAFGVVTGKSDEALDLIRHDAAHVLASAVIDLYPGTKVSIGPSIENGFYYDFDFPEGITISEDDLPAIEDRMREHIKAAESFERSDIPVAEALERFKALGEDYKVELIEDLIINESVETVSLYRNGEFTDLCRGPHTPATDRIKAIALQSVAGAYWRGDSTRKMLTRIYGTAFLSQKELDAHLELLEEARARDHRRLGTQLNLFRFSEVSPGSAFWLPRGTQLFNSLVELSREMGAPRGYQEVKTPQLYDAELWRTSGHWDKYRENMFLTESEDRPMGLKPMNCPGHAHLYGSQQWSYRDLPVRYSEPGLLHRNEPSGTLHGLLRVRHFCQDDAHIFCTEDQIQSEVASCLEFAFATYRLFGLEPSLELSTRPDQRIGDDATWDRAESALREALDQEGHPYTVNEGDGAFYGPKIDLHITDSLGRSWQLGTVQLDYSMPERFDLAYTGADNAEHRPVMIHRALMGSYERFIGILIEHYAGVFPFWFAPIQIAVLPVADRHLDYAKEVAACLAESGLRADIDERTESVGRKIRDAEISKAPVMLIVGDREAEGRSVSVRERADGDLGDEKLDALVARLSAKAANRDA